MGFTLGKYSVHVNISLIAPCGTCDVCVLCCVLAVCVPVCGVCRYMTGVRLISQTESRKVQEDRKKRCE